MLNAKPMASATVAVAVDGEGRDYLRVAVTWTVAGATLDRPSTGGFGLKLSHRALAERLVRAINAQAVFANPAIKRDVNGATYISAASRVLGRMINADLRRLGF